MALKSKDDTAFSLELHSVESPRSFFLHFLKMHPRRAPHHPARFAPPPLWRPPMPPRSPFLLFSSFILQYPLHRSMRRPRAPRRIQGRRPLAKWDALAERWSQPSQFPLALSGPLFGGRRELTNPKHSEAAHQSESSAASNWRLSRCELSPPPNSIRANSPASKRQIDRFRHQDRE